jgi:hypothetical protein
MTAKRRPKAPVRADSAPITPLMASGSPGIGGRFIIRGGGLVSGGDDRFECFAFVAEIALGGFDQVGDQVIAAFQLNIDLGVGIFESDFAE